MGVKSEVVEDMRKCREREIELAKDERMKEGYSRRHIAPSEWLKGCPQVTDFGRSEGWLERYGKVGQR